MLHDPRTESYTDRLNSRLSFSDRKSGGPEYTNYGLPRGPLDSFERPSNSWGYDSVLSRRAPHECCIVSLRSNRGDEKAAELPVAVMRGVVSV